ncbi:unnamed protein product, partial [Iphiclides podalirius]
MHTGGPVRVRTTDAHRRATKIATPIAQTHQHTPTRFVYTSGNRGGPTPPPGYVENVKEKGDVFMYHMQKLGPGRAAAFSRSVRGEGRASGYRFRLAPINDPARGSRIRGSRTGSPRFMTYMAWERSSRCACSTAWYTPESTLGTETDPITKWKHCAERKHLMWTLALATSAAAKH